MILIQFHEDCGTEDPSPMMWIIDSTQHLQISKWHEALTAAVGRLIWATGRIFTHQQLPKTTTRPAVTSCYVCLQLLSLQLFPLKKSRQSCSLSLLQRKTNKQKPAPRRKLEFVDGESGGLSKEGMQVTVWAYIDKLSDDAQRQMAERQKLRGRWLRFACLENLWLWVRCTSLSWMCKNYSTEANVAATYSSCQYSVTTTFKLN